MISGIKINSLGINVVLMSTSSLSLQLGKRSVSGDVQLELVTFRFLQRFSLHPLEAVSVLAATV
jgi:hypothetical protein